MPHVTHCHLNCMAVPNHVSQLIQNYVDSSPHRLELTWLRDWDRPYNLGDNEFHVAFYVDDYEGALAKHKAMNCVAYENEAMGIYFIADPDGYWTEIIPAGAY